MLLVRTRTRYELLMYDTRGYLPRVYRRKSAVCDLRNVTIVVLISKKLSVPSEQFRWLPLSFTNKPPDRQHLFQGERTLEEVNTEMDSPLPPKVQLCLAIPHCCHPRHNLIVTRSVREEGKKKAHAHGHRGVLHVLLVRYLRVRCASPHHGW